MNEVNIKSKRKILKLIFLVKIVILVLPSISFAFSPIARWDAVPYDRIPYGSSIKLGVVAFSKPGIASVSITPSGQGYSGGAKSASLALNTDHAFDNSTLGVDSKVEMSWPGVYEWYVTVSASEFTSNGTVTFSCTVTDNNSNERELDSLTLIVEGASSPTRHFAYVDGTIGNDGTGKADNSEAPFQTIAAAISAAQTANSGSSDGNIIYLEEGTYSIGTTSPTTTSDWLTVTKSPTASIANVIINNANISTNHLKFQSIKLDGSSNGVFLMTNPTNLWTDGCIAVSGGRNSSCPIDRMSTAYTTNSYIYNVLFAQRQGTVLARNVTIYKTGDDAFVNNPLVVNARIDDVNPLEDGSVAHANAYQIWGTARDNYIVYGIYATNLNYEGLRLRQESGGLSEDNAFVNNFFEMRAWTPDGDSGGYSAIVGQYDHLLLWHNSFVVTGSEPSHWAFGSLLLGAESTGHGWTNSSFVGNVFGQFIENEYDAWTYATYFNPGNSYNNICENNHYNYSYQNGDSGRTLLNNYINSKSFSPSSDGSSSHGDGALNLSDKNTYVKFGHPKDGSVLINRLDTVFVAADVLGNLRDSSPDVGAIEATSDSNYLFPPNNVTIQTP